VTSAEHTLFGGNLLVLVSTCIYYLYMEFEVPRFLVRGYMS